MPLRKHAHSGGSFFIQRAEMKYTKPSLSFSAQADLLLQRGLIADKAQLVSVLEKINYYRLTAFLYPSRDPNNGDNFLPGTSLNKTLEIYRFDETLRNMLQAGVERVEIIFRTQIAYHFSQSCGPFGYTKSKNLPHLTNSEFRLFLKNIRTETGRSSELFVKHFKTKYGDRHKYLPVWMAVDIMSFGTLSTMLRGINQPIRAQIASDLGITDKVLLSWSRSLRSLRNTCAHCARVWNRTFGDTPIIPHDALWTTPVQIENKKIFGFSSIIAYLCDHGGVHSSWKADFKNLLRQMNPNALPYLGFPSDWEQSPIWA